MHSHEMETNKSGVGGPFFCWLYGPLILKLSTKSCMNGLLLGNEIDYESQQYMNI